MYGGIRHDAARADVRAAGFELRLHERNHAAPRPEQWRHDREDLGQGDERHIDCDDVEGAKIGWKIGGSEITRVHALEADHARILAEAPVELVVAHVDWHHPCGAAGEQYVRE